MCTQPPAMPACLSILLPSSTGVAARVCVDRGRPASQARGARLQPAARSRQLSGAAQPGAHVLHRGAIRCPAADALLCCRCMCLACLQSCLLLSPCLLLTSCPNVRLQTAMKMLYWSILVRPLDSH